MTEIEFISIIQENPVNKIILDRLPSLNIPDTWLVSGSLFQTVWNKISQFEIEHGIKDYDIFYFDESDLSWEAEDRVIQKVKSLFNDIEANIEVKNQARVHLWYPQKFNLPYPALSSTTEGIDRFLAKACQVGIKAENNIKEVYAPSGFDDLENMIIRPNITPNFSHSPYLEKANRWKKNWPSLTVFEN